MIGVVFTALGYLAGLSVFCCSAYRRGFEAKTIAWLSLAGLAGGIVAAKIVRLLFATTSGISPLTLAAHPDGRTIIGGVIGGWLAVELIKRAIGIRRSTGDAFALALPLGEAIGRLGCFLNGCCYGAPCNLPWAVYQHGQWRHPAQIYCMVTELCIFAFLWFMQTRVSREGDLFRWYLILWAGTRFMLEFLRQRTDVHFGLSIAQWISAEVVVGILIGVLCMKLIAQRQGKAQLQ